jgi:methionine-gamma-lyase
MKKKPLYRPETLMMSYGYKPALSEGAVKCPIFQTSTFAFPTAEAGKAFFEVAYGMREQGKSEEIGLIYSRLNNPDLEILENRLALWDQADDCAVFESGMSAISTAMMEFLEPGDILLFSSPVYGGTDHFIKHFLVKYGITPIEFHSDESMEQIIQKVEATGKPDRLRMVYLETPANPTNTLFDIRECRALANHFATEEHQVLVAVDNTYMGPLWQHPIPLGADLVIYSATKYIGGHSDVIAGAVLGNEELIKRIKTLRTFFGNMAGPWTGWLLLRSLETLKLRMEKQTANAQKIADYLVQHEKIDAVHYLGLLTEADGLQYKRYVEQCSAPGAMISFEVKGGEKEAFTFLNNLHLIKLAVSLGSTESLAQHPATMTHAGVDPDTRLELGITENLVRLSVGVEHPEDLMHDIGRALEEVDLSHYEDVKKWPVKEGVK